MVTTTGASPSESSSISSRRGLPINARASAHICWFDLRGRGKISRAQRAATAAAYVLWMALIDCDVMFGANYFLPRLLGAIARRRVITIHDLTYKRFPNLLQKETLHNLEAHMPREIAAADAIICVSESTREDLLRFEELGVDRVTVNPLRESAEPIPVRQALGQMERVAEALGLPARG